MGFNKDSKQALSLQPSAENARLFSLWQAARDQKGRVRRDALGLRALSQFHEKLFIMERFAGDGLRLRLAGAQLNRLWGSNMRGRDLREKAGDFEDVVLGRLFNHCMNYADPILARLRLLRLTQEPMVAELLGLPLLNPQDEVQILGALLLLDEYEQNPIKFESISTIQIIATRILTGEMQSNLLIFPFAKQIFLQNSMNSEEFIFTR